MIGLSTDRVFQRAKNEVEPLPSRGLDVRACLTKIRAERDGAESIKPMLRGFENGSDLGPTRLGPLRIEAGFELVGAAP
jgi:hypothetical protein